MYSIYIYTYIEITLFCITLSIVTSLSMNRNALLSRGIKGSHESNEHHAGMQLKLI